VGQTPGVLQAEQRCSGLAQQLLGTGAARVECSFELNSSRRERMNSVRIGMLALATLERTDGLDAEASVPTGPSTPGLAPLHLPLWVTSHALRPAAAPAPRASSAGSGAARRTRTVVSCWCRDASSTEHEEG
jgi:hypothetical protein